MGSTRCRDRKARLGQPVLGVSRFRALGPRGFRFAMVPRAALNRFSDSMTTEVGELYQADTKPGSPSAWASNDAVARQPRFMWRALWRDAKVIALRAKFAQITFREPFSP